MENQQQGGLNPEQINQQFNQQFGQPFGQQQVPNSTAVLVLGIISIVGCFCYGIIGLILGIVALVLSSKAKSLYEQSPGAYSQASYNNLKAGRICAIIGTSLSAVYILILIVYIIFLGTVFSGLPWEQMMKH